MADGLAYNRLRGIPMSMTLRPDTEQRIAEQMRAGRYSSADDVVLDALHLLEQRSRDRKQDADLMRQKITVGLEQLERGEGLDGDKVFAELLEDLERQEG